MSGSAAMCSFGDARSASADASQLGGSSADASQLGGSSAVYCPACDMWLNGMDEYNDHVLRKKHRNNLNKRVGHEQGGGRDKGLVIPRGTAIIIEQGAILSDATELGQPAQSPDGAVSSDLAEAGGWRLAEADDWHFAEAGDCHWAEAGVGLRR